MSLNAIPPTFTAAAEQQIVRRMAFAQISADFRITDISDNWAHITHLVPPDVAAGPFLWDVFDEFFGLDTYIHQVLRGPHPRYRLERVNRSLPGGAVIYLDFTLSRSPIAKASGYLLMVEDATTFGRLEQAIVQERNELRLAKQKLAAANMQLRRLNRLKSLFFSMAAHDLRSPLMVIRGYSELLHTLVETPEEPASSNETREKLDFIETIRVQSDWLDNIIHNVLALNRIENDQWTFELRLQPLAPLIEQIRDIMEPMARLNQHTLHMNELSSDVLIHADSERLLQALQNLIGNAFKYTGPDGHIHVETTASAEQVKIIVRDNGRGLSQEQQQAVFEIYYRTEEAEQSNIRGSGLGLYIVQSIVEAHSGTIEIESELGVGTTFTICLPRAMA